MSKNPPINISPGRITGIWLLIKIAIENESIGITIESAIKSTSSSALRGGSLPIKESLTLGIFYDFLFIEGGLLKISEFSKRELIRYYASEEPNELILRIIYSQIIDIRRDSWIVFLDSDPEEFKPLIPDYWVELLENADLFNFKDEEVIKWWKSIRNKKEQYFQDRNNKVGACGEKLTVEFEESRLKNDNIDHPELFVKQVSLISNDFGYDVQSIRGNLFLKSKAIKDQLMIEVKSSSIENEKQFLCYLTKNEWETAKKNLDNFFFHCWIGINIKDCTAKKGPYILSAHEVEPLVPTNNSDQCQWELSKLLLDLTQCKLEYIPA